MQYKVPQFIEVEDKIFGPLTFRQFLYVAGAGGIILVLITFLPLFIAITVSIPFMVAGGALAFYKVNDRPLIETLEHAFGYLTGYKLYLWKHRPEKSPSEITPRSHPQAAVIVTPKFSESKLKDLAWSLNIKDRLAEEDQIQDS